MREQLPFLRLPERRDAAPEPERELLWSGDELGLVAQVAVDPEGRFALLRAFPSGDLWRLELDARGRAPALALSARDVPHLQQVRGLRFEDHARLGRVLVMRESVGCVLPAGARESWWIDAADDGSFERLLTLTTAQRNALGWDFDADRRDAVAN